MVLVNSGHATEIVETVAFAKIEGNFQFLSVILRTQSTFGQTPSGLVVNIMSRHDHMIKISRTATKVTFLLGTSCVICLVSGLWLHSYLFVFVFGWVWIFFNHCLVAKHFGLSGMYWCCWSLLTVKHYNTLHVFAVAACFRMYCVRVVIVRHMDLSAVLNGHW